MFRGRKQKTDTCPWILLRPKRIKTSDNVWQCIKNNLCLSKISLETSVYEEANARIDSNGNHNNNHDLLLCVDTHEYTYIHAYIHTYLHAYIHTYIHTDMHTYIPVSYTHLTLPTNREV